MRSRTRIAVWMLVMDRKLGLTDAAVRDSFPSLSQADLDAAWEYYRNGPGEGMRAIDFTCLVLLIISATGFFSGGR